MNKPRNRAATVSRHAAIVLAAGASTRLGRAKQLLLLDDETLLHRAARLALQTSPRECWVVLGADAGAMTSALAGLPVNVAHCENWQDGMGASLATGIAALSRDAEAALIVLCDQPALDIAHLSTLLDAWRATPLRAVASSYAQRLGVPAVLPRTWFAALRDARDDQGARELLREHAETVIRIENEKLALDIDSVDDLPALARLSLR